MSPSGVPYSDDQICQKGKCSHKIPGFDLENIRTQMFFCNVSNTIDKNDKALCGAPSPLILTGNNSALLSKSLKIFREPIKVVVVDNTTTTSPPS